MKHFISLASTSTEALRHILDVAKRLKSQLKETGRNDPILAGKTLLCIFEKPSLRTRVSFSVGMTQLGGASIVLGGEEAALGQREPIADFARVVSGMCDGIMARTFEHQKILDLVKYSTIPVINGLTDYSHPCQAMADIMTIEEHFEAGGGSLEGKTLAYVGDGNNVARSLSVACGKFGMRCIVATPPGFTLPEDDMDRIMSQVPGMDFETTNDPADAVREADVIYTDTWVSMGQELSKQERVKAFDGYQVNEQLLSNAPKHAIVLHCLPAYRGLEISDDVMESPRSRIFEQAHNRLHAQKGLLAVLLGGA